MTDIAVVGEEPTSIFQGALPVEAKLERARTELLDLSARNRLLNMPRSGKSAKILGSSMSVAQKCSGFLVGAQRALTFKAGRAAPGSVADGETSADEAEEIAELAQPEEDDLDDRGVQLRRSRRGCSLRQGPAMYLRQDNDREASRQPGCMQTGVR